MRKSDQNIKTFNMRIPKEMWMFLKQTAAQQEVSMTEIIVRCVDKYKKKFDDRLTVSDTHV